MEKRSGGSACHRRRQYGKILYYERQLTEENGDPDAGVFEFVPDDTP
jgi:hypothetical protein